MNSFCRYVDFFNNFADGVDRYQTLLAGILAILAAYIGARAIFYQTNRTLAAQEQSDKDTKARRKTYVCYTLASELSLLADNSTQAANRIRDSARSFGTSLFELRKDTGLEVPELTSNWESMSLLSNDVFERLLFLKRCILNYNRDLDQSPSVFEGDNQRTYLIECAEHISKTAMDLSMELLGKPFWGVPDS